MLLLTGQLQKVGVSIPWMAKTLPTRMLTSLSRRRMDWSSPIFILRTQTAMAAHQIFLELRQVLGDTLPPLNQMEASAVSVG